MGLCEAVLAVVSDVSEDEPVSRVRLRVGRLQCVVPDVSSSAGARSPWTLVRPTRRWSCRPSLATS